MTSNHRLSYTSLSMTARCLRSSKKSGTSIMQQAINSVDSWSSQNHMNINTKKTKEMLIGSIQKNPPPLLQIDGQSVERVTSYKLLGLQVTESLQWNEHVSHYVPGRHSVFIFSGTEARSYVFRRPIITSLL